MAEEGRVGERLGRARPATTPANGDNAHAPSDLDPFPHPIERSDLNVTSTESELNVPPGTAADDALMAIFGLLRVRVVTVEVEKSDADHSVDVTEMGTTVPNGGW